MHILLQIENMKGLMFNYNYGREYLEAFLDHDGMSKYKAVQTTEVSNDPMKTVQQCQ